MLLFIHGTGATNSLWLPQIRGLLGLDSKYSDAELIKHFTIQLPGHIKDDRYFSISDIEKLIQTFREDNYEYQRDLAAKFILNNASGLAKHLSDRRLILVGHSVGGVISMHYAAHHIESMRALVLIGCGNNFNQIVRTYGKFTHRSLYKKDLRKLNALAPKITDIRKRLLVNIFAENPERKGFKSCLDIVDHHNASKWYKKLSLNEQIKLSELPILLVNGRFDLINTVFSARKFAKILQSRKTLIEPKKTVISLDQRKPKTKV
jgi:pimeloyl-ACP methyl ester carboxylesterase